MAEYYAVLKKAVGGLDAGSAEARRAVYDKARNALIGQLKAIDPPLAASEISRQRLELEEAIRRVERETASEGQGARRSAPVEAEPAPSTAPEPVPPPTRHSGPPSPQDIFRRAIQDAEARGTAAAYQAERPSARPANHYEDDNVAVQPPGNRTQDGRRPEYRNDISQPPSARLAPDYDEEWEARESVEDLPPEPYADRRSRAGGRRRQEYVADAEDMGPEMPARRSRLPTILLSLLILVMIGGLGALAWSQRDVITDLLGSFDSGSSEVAAPELAPEPPETASKSTDRLGGAPEADSSVRVVGESDAGNVPAPPDLPSDAIAGAIAEAPPATNNAASELKAVLYEEPLDATAAATGVTAIDAVLNWQFVKDGTSGPEITASIEVPERAMKIHLVIRRNTDPTLPASHLVETVITTPPDFPGKGIRSVPRLVLKEAEDQRGEPLIGAAAKVADGYFWIALSAADADVTRNLQLLKDRSWIDLPLVYETGQRAILTFEKGAQGDDVFENAFAAWSTG